MLSKNYETTHFVFEFNFLQVSGVKVGEEMKPGHRSLHPVR